MLCSPLRRDQSVIDDRCANRITSSIGTSITEDNPLACSRQRSDVTVVREFGGKDVVTSRLRRYEI